MEEKILRYLNNNLNKELNLQELCTYLKLNSNEVLETINTLINKGYQIIKDDNTFCLVEPIDFLDETSIKQYLIKNHPIKIFTTINSTNQLLKENCNSFVEGQLIISDYQTKGRGRLERNFYSPSNKGIYLSLLIKPNTTITETLRITTLTATAIYQAIKNIYNLDLKIKWVNDLMLENLKVGGILCESILHHDNSTISDLIIGIGLNVKAQTFPNELIDIATSIENHATQRISRNRIIAEIINCFDNLCDDKIDFLPLYRKQSYIIGQEILVYQNNLEYTAEAVDINSNGELIIKHQGRLEILNSGEITIRKK